MPIKAYMEANSLDLIDILDMYELDFVDSDNEEEAVENIKQVLSISPTYEALALVMRSYYLGTVSRD